MTQIKASLIDCMGSDLSVVNAARVSFGKESKMLCTDQKLGVYDLAEGDKRLISYLAKHKHTSPFGHCFASFHVKAPIFCARQLVKHKFLRWNEISRRYVDDTPEYFEDMPWRGRAENKKQGSADPLPDDEQEIMYSISKTAAVSEIGWNDMATGFYRHLLSKGVCEEQARMILPTSLMTEWWWSGSLDAFADMVNLRDKDDTQYETRLVAVDINREMAKLFPYSWKALTS